MDFVAHEKDEDFLKNQKIERPVKKDVSALTGRTMKQIEKDHDAEWANEKITHPFGDEVRMTEILSKLTPASDAYRGQRIKCNGE